MIWIVLIWFTDSTTSPDPYYLRIVLSAYRLWFFVMSLRFAHFCSLQWLNIAFLWTALVCVCHTMNKRLLTYLYIYNNHGNCYYMLYADRRDYCLHETFNATCRAGSVLLMTSAVYGRMRIGRCIDGDFNIGCATDVLRYFDSQCTARQSCDVDVRNLVDLHPCQRDFMSYLEASYRCVQGMAWYSTIFVHRSIFMTRCYPTHNQLTQLDPKKCTKPNRISCYIQFR